MSRSRGQQSYSGEADVAVEGVPAAPGGWLYVVAWRPRGPVKVGRCTDLDQRLAALRNGCPYRLRYFDQVWCASFAYEMEREAHRLLAARRLAREWFLSTTDEAENVIRDVEDNYLFRILAEEMGNPGFGADALERPLVPLGPPRWGRPIS